MSQLYDQDFEVTEQSGRDLAALCSELARSAGAFAAQARRGAIEVAATKSSASDVVTEADRAVERQLRAALAERRPDDAILGEEGQDTPGRSGLTWLLDPIDGTVNYLYGIDQYAVSVAVVAGDPRVPGAWHPVAGCVYNPASDREWTAARGQGAWTVGRSDAHAPRERQMLSMSEPPPLALALIGTGFSYLPERRVQQGAVVAELLGQVRDIRRLGSSALDLCAVADGRLDAFYEVGLNVWDIAAGLLMVTEAGGVVRELPGGSVDGRLLVAGGDRLVQDLVGIVTYV